MKEETIRIFSYKWNKAAVNSPAYPGNHQRMRISEICIILLHLLYLSCKLHIDKSIYMTREIDFRTMQDEKSRKKHSTYTSYSMPQTANQFIGKSKYSTIFSTLHMYTLHTYIYKYTELDRSPWINLKWGKWNPFAGILSDLCTTLP